MQKMSPLKKRQKDRKQIIVRATYSRHPVELEIWVGHAASGCGLQDNLGRNDFLGLRSKQLVEGDWNTHLFTRSHGDKGLFGLLLP